MTTRLRIDDAWRETAAAIFERPARSLLTVVSIAAGVAALVATIGVSRTAGNQILERFDVVGATRITIALPAPSDVVANPVPFAWRAEEQLGRLNGVTAAGTFARVDVGAAQVRAVVAYDPAGLGAFPATVLVASEGLPAAAGAHVRDGRFIDRGDEGRLVAVLGSDVAGRVVRVSVAERPAVILGNRILTVVGVLTPAEGLPMLDGAIMVPASTAAEHFSVGQAEGVLVDTDLGATRLVATQVAMALAPNDPSVLEVQAPPDPEQLRRGVRGDVDRVLVLLGVVSVLVGAIGVTNTMLVAVLQRTREFGLRRACGATRRHVMVHVVAESATIGLTGGLLGTTIGVLTTVVVAAFQHWTPVLDPIVLLVAVPAATAVTTLAGLGPARRAASIDPVVALRG